MESLYRTFGGTVNSKGYKELDPHIGVIYGDSITLEIMESILERLEANGFASTNVVFGIGSFTYQHVTRDTLGFAMKATQVTVNGEDRDIFKDPVTDDGVKKSLKGRIRVFLNDDGELEAQEGVTREEEETSVLTDLYVDGTLIRETDLNEIRCRVNGEKLPMEDNDD